MKMFGNLARRLARDEDGAALAEYAAIFLVLATAGTVILLTVGATLEATGTAIDNWLTTNVLNSFTGG